MSMMSVGGLIDEHRCTQECCFLSTVIVMMMMMMILMMMMMIMILTSVVEVGQSIVDLER